MKKARIGLIVGVLGFVWLIQGVPQANAIKPFFDQFVAVYVKSDSTDSKDKAFAEAVAKTKCNVCHEGKSKKIRNPYGKALDELLDRKTDAEDKEKIIAALKKVEATRVDPKDEKSPTFGERIRDGKLPVEPKAAQ